MNVRDSYPAGRTKFDKEPNRMTTLTSADGTALSTYCQRPEKDLIRITGW